MGKAVVYFAVPKHRGVDDRAVPVGGCFGEDGGVEDVVVAVEGVGAAGLASLVVVGGGVEGMLEGIPQTGIVLEDVVAVQLVPVTCQCTVPMLDWCISQIKPRSARLGVGNKRLVEHKAREITVEVQSIAQPRHHCLTGEVLPVVGDKAVVREGVHHGAWSANCGVVSSILSRHENGSRTVVCPRRMPCVW